MLENEMAKHEVGEDEVAWFVFMQSARCGAELIIEVELLERMLYM